MTILPLPYPPMGWNSWDCFGTTVTEAEVRENAKFMADNLADFGWDTVVIDIDWSDPTARSHGYNADAPLHFDQSGRLIPDPGRFPSSADGKGFKPLADYIHGLGLKFGIHTMRGVPRAALAPEGILVEGTEIPLRSIADHTNTCEWNPDMVGIDLQAPGGQEYYDSTLRLYASWEVDYIKCDDMLWPYQQADIEAYAHAIELTGRPITLSLSPGRDLSLTRLENLRAHASTWRISDDLWDKWEDVEANFARFARWTPYASPHGWPDGDMLPIGKIGIRAERGEPRDSLLTIHEQKTLLSLWVMGRSPLMIGGHLPQSSPETVKLLQNRKLFEIHKNAHESREILRENGLSVWLAHTGSEEPVVAVFNLQDSARALELDAGDLGLTAALQKPLVDVWGGDSILTTYYPPGSVPARGVAQNSTGIEIRLAPHGCVLITPED